MMKTKILALLSIILLVATGCKTKNKTVKNSDIYYTCSMHPQVVSEEPGKCPICAMDLIPVTRNKTGAVQEVELSNEQIQLANITFDTLSAGALNNETILTGTINFNEKNIETIPSRVMGRIERLYYRNVGDYVSKGSKIYELYSEELNSAKQEYLLMLQKRQSLGNTVINFDQLIEGAKNKLLLWGMTKGQINDLKRSGKAPLTTSFFSNASGFITSLDAVEGAYVMEGESLFRLANTSTVWAEAQVYTSQLSQLSKTGNVTVRLPDLGNKEVNGKIEFANPEINPQTRLNLLRVAIPNPGNQLKPGMSAYVIVKGQQSGSINLPIDAVIRSENMATVWLKSGPNKFRYQMVKTGLESNNRIEITYGLKSGDTVVISGAYLLNSEYNSRNGGSAMGGMKM